MTTKFHLWVKNRFREKKKWNFNFENKIQELSEISAQTSCNSVNEQKKLAFRRKSTQQFLSKKCQLLKSQRTQSCEGHQWTDATFERFEFLLFRHIVCTTMPLKLSNACTSYKLVLFTSQLIYKYVYNPFYVR